MLSLVSTHPNIAAEWNHARNGKLSLRQFTYGSTSRVWWICSKCGYEWETTICNRTCGYFKTGCPKCSGEHSTSFPELAKQWDFNRNGTLLPENISYGSVRKVWWICPVCGRSFLKSVNTRTATRTRNLQHCPYCPTRRGEASRKPVICLETGKTYPSAEAAAAEVSRTGGAISVACREGTKSAGFHWKYVSENDV